MTDRESESVGYCVYASGADCIACTLSTGVYTGLTNWVA